MESLVCSFFGHRKIEITDRVKQKVKKCVENLIVAENVKIFLFGSKSNFNDLCHLIVTELKKEYPDIKRIYYTCKSESCTLEEDREEKEKIYSSLTNQNIRLLGFEEEFEHKTKNCAGKASYIERNKAMIDDSVFCVFYYDSNYKPPTNTNSGTELAYKYAKNNSKKIINILNN